MRVRATIVQTDTIAAGIPIPHDVVEGLASGRRAPVRMTINGRTCRIGAASRPSTVKSWSGSARRTAGKAAPAGGDAVDVHIEVDAQPRDVTVPPYFPLALDREPAARRFFEGLTYSVQQWHVLSVEGAKTPDTRQRRIEKSVAVLREGRARWSGA